MNQTDFFITCQNDPPPHAVIGVSLETDIGVIVVENVGVGALGSCSSYLPSVLLVSDPGEPLPSYSELPLGPPDLTKYGSFL